MGIIERLRAARGKVLVVENALLRSRHDLGGVWR